MFLPTNSIYQSNEIAIFFRDLELKFARGITFDSLKKILEDYFDIVLLVQIFPLIQLAG